MKAKNLETGAIMNVGEGFLDQQAKPYLTTAGEMFPDGVWVEFKGKKKGSAPKKKAIAKKVVAKKSSKPKPVAKKAAGKKR